MMNIPIRPGYYSKLDMLDGLHEVDEVPSPFTPVAASLVAIDREARESEQVELWEQNRAERKWTACFFAVMGLLVAAELGLGPLLHMLGVKL